MDAMSFAPSTVKPRPVRERPYSIFVTDVFDPAKTTAADRVVARFLYRAFRKQQHSTPASARAQIATWLMLDERR